MSSTVRMQCSFQIDSAAPTDVLMINPHFHITDALGASPDYQALTNDLADGLNTWQTILTQLTVKCYDVAGPPPHYPLATAVRRQGTIAVANVNRDLAVCLSYYATDNRPRRRGRLYVPAVVCGVTPTGAFIAAASMTKVSSLVPVLTGLGGINVDWVVYSERDSASHPVTNWYVDNNWDTQRRRGPLATARQSGTTTEGDVPNFVALQAAPPSEDLSGEPTVK